MLQPKSSQSPPEDNLAARDKAVNNSVWATQDKPWPGSGIILTWFALAFSLICVTSFLQKSPTVDEPVHLLAGYSYLKWGDFRVNPEHPPLAKIWAAFPLLTIAIKDSRLSRPQWDLIPQTSDHQFASHLAQDMVFVDNDGETLFFFAKLQMIALGILLGGFVYLWAGKLFGFAAAWLALFIYCLDPNILAHSQLVHTDVPFATFFFIGTYFFSRCTNQFTRSNLIFTSLFFALAAITKYSFLAIVPAWIILGLVSMFASEPVESCLGAPRLVTNKWSKGGLYLTILACSAVAAYLAIWAAYGFRFFAISGGAQSLPITEIMPESFLLKRFVRAILDYHLFPEAWTYGQLYVLRDLDRRTYFLGELSTEGFWSYFPVVFLVKTPLPTLLLILATVWIWLSRRQRWNASLPLVIAPAVYFGLAVFSGLNIGLRHILSVYPFLFVFIAGGAVELWHRAAKVTRIALILLSVWYVATSIRIYPHYLAYFNELVGGPKSGYKVVVDSNLDWGQDVKGVKRWMDEHGVDKIQWVYFGYVDPEYYGIDAVDLPGKSFAYVPTATGSGDLPKYLALSATYLGLFQDKPFIKAMQKKAPVATIGHSIYVYKVD